jgi:hypothetical protein
LLKEQKISYPLHVSGHGLVEWVQRYACAKLSETIWLAGGRVFTGATYQDMLVHKKCGAKIIGLTPAGKKNKLHWQYKATKKP